MIGKMISLGCLEPQILDTMQYLRQYVESVSIRNDSDTPKLVMETDKGPIILTNYVDENDFEDDLNEDPEFNQFFEDIYDFQYQECQQKSDNNIDIQGLERIIKGEPFRDYEYIWHHDPIIYYWYQELCVIDRNSF